MYILDFDILDCSGDTAELIDLPAIGPYLALQDAMVTTTTPGGQRVSICTCTQTGRHLATFTRRPGLILYTLATEPPQVAASAQVFATGQVAASCSSRLLSHQTLLWHHRLGHPSLPRLRGMHSYLLTVSSLASDSVKTSLSCVCTLTEVRRIGLVMEVARTSMIHAAAPHFLWPFEVWYAAHQLNLWLRVSFPETSPTLRWSGEVGDASVFRVWGSRAFVRDTSADKLSARAIPYVFLGLVLDVPGWQFYHPTSHRVLPSQDVTFDESVPFYRLFPYRSVPLPPPPLFLAPGPPPVDPLPGTAPVLVAVISRASPGAASGGAEPGGAGSKGAESGGAEPESVEPGGVESEGAEFGGAKPWGAASSGGAGDIGARSGVVPTGAVGTGGVGCAGAGDPMDPGAACTIGAGAGVAGVGGSSAGGSGAAGAGVGGTGAGGAGAAGAGAVDPGA
ncbi:unnamed protein product [Closterium sp. NIES-54]